MTIPVAPPSLAANLAAFHRRRLITCVRCGKRRFATVVNAAYCSPICKARAQYQRRKARNAMKLAQNGDVPKVG